MTKAQCMGLEKGRWYSVWINMYFTFHFNDQPFKWVPVCHLKPTPQSDMVVLLFNIPGLPLAVSLFTTLVFELPLQCIIFFFPSPLSLKISKKNC